MKSNMKWIWIGLGGGVVFLILALGTMYTVNEREVAVVLEFGKPVASRTEPGLYFKIPMMQNVETYPKTMQFWRSSPQEMLVDLQTKDKKKIEVAAWVIWKITDPKKFRQVMVTMEAAESNVKARVRAAIRDAISQRDLSQFIRSSQRELTYSLQVADPEEDGDPTNLPGENAPENVKPQGESIAGRKEILKEIRQEVQSRLQGQSTGKGENNAQEETDSDRGIELVDVGIYNISFVASVRENAFERLKTAMEAIAEKHTSEGKQQKIEIISSTKEEVEQILGEGKGQSAEIRGTVDAEIIEEYAKAINETGDFYNFERTLELYKNSLSGRSNRLILTTDTELFRLLKELDKAVPAPTMPPEAVPAETPPVTEAKAEPGEE